MFIEVRKKLLLLFFLHLLESCTTFIFAFELLYDDLWCASLPLVCEQIRIILKLHLLFQIIIFKFVCQIEISWVQTELQAVIIVRRGLPGATCFVVGGT